MPWKLGTKINAKLQLTRETKTKLGELPVTMEFIKSKAIVSLFGMKQVENNFFKGIKIRATYNSDNSFEIDKRKGKKVDKETKALLLSSLEDSFPDIDFPNKPMSIGDQFERKR